MGYEDWRDNLARWWRRGWSVEVWSPGVEPGNGHWAEVSRYRRRTRAWRDRRILVGDLPGRAVVYPSSNVRVVAT